MKTLITLLLVALFISQSHANDLEIATRVQSVTIYHSGALVYRTASVNLNSGVTELTVRNILALQAMSKFRTIAAPSF